MDPLVQFCKNYLKRHRGGGYDFNKNGEALLLKKLSKLSFATVFDVGANVGEWSKIAAEYFPKANFHVFELASETYKTLARELTGKKFTLNELGLAAKEGEVVYKDYGVNSGANTLLLEASFHDKEAAPALLKGKLTTGALYCAKHKIQELDFLKLDVEGAEHLVLEGFASLLQKQKIRVIQFEYGYINGDSKFLMRDFYEFFEKYGYRVGRLEKRSVAFLPWTYSLNNFDSGPNYVAIKQNDEELFSLLSK